MVASSVEDWVLTFRRVSVGSRRGRKRHSNFVHLVASVNDASVSICTVESSLVGSVSLVLASVDRDDNL